MSECDYCDRSDELWIGTGRDQETYVVCRDHAHLVDVDPPLL